MYYPVYNMCFYLTLQLHTVYLYYLLWPPLSQRKRATRFTTTPSKAPASTANLALFVKIIWAPPKESPPWSRTAPLPSPSPLPPVSSASPALFGWPPNRLAFSTCSCRFVQSHGLGLPRLTTSCSPLFIAFANQAPRPKFRIGMFRPRFRLSGISLPPA